MLTDGRAGALSGADTPEYAQATESERRRYENCTNVHDLPKIADYWANRYIRPVVESFGFDSPNGAFVKYLDEQCRRESATPKRFVSLGSGNCDLEVEIALALRARGHERFVIDCLDLNPVMLERGRAASVTAGAGDNLSFAAGDFNHWVPEHRYDAVIANQSLHHVLNLEGLFRQVKAALQPGGYFVTSDMIGRNGHLRWPEALDLVHSFWRRLPLLYRINSRTGRYEEMFQDWDCSQEDFEGIRSQDILPLLLENFHFRLFMPFGNVIDPFVDRSFGYRFDPEIAWDREFIDEVHACDVAAMDAGLVKPTHMIAVMTAEPQGECLFPGKLSPQFCVRRPDAPCVPAGSKEQPYTGMAPELEAVGRRLAALESAADASAGEIDNCTQWANRLDNQLIQYRELVHRLQADLEERTQWALRLDAELRERTELALELRAELEARTHWAVRLGDDLKQHAALLPSLQNLQDEVATRTGWALELERELHDRTQWAFALRDEVKAAGEIDEELRRKSQQVEQLQAELDEARARPSRGSFSYVRARVGSALRRAGIIRPVKPGSGELR